MDTSNNMNDYQSRFTNELHDAFNKLSHSPIEAQSAPLGVMVLDDGRRAQVQLVVTTNEDDFLDD